MSVIGIVCEYNPFHNGHKFHLDKARQTGAGDNTIICVMSGDFVQRGEAAMYSKYARAEAACRCGADLVVELPLPWCLSGAERFALGAVSLLHDLGSDTISFGSECGDVNALDNIARFLIKEETNRNIYNIMKASPELSYASAREKAAENAGVCSGLLRSPNNILAVEYLKAIRLLGINMKAATVARVGSGHDQKGEGIFRSASELRDFLTEDRSIREYIPVEAYEVYSREREQGRELADKSCYETALLSRLRMLNEDAFMELPDGETGLCRRIFRAVQTECTLQGIFDAAKTKRYAHSRIRRLCLSAALGLKDGAYTQLPPYARILAANARGRDHLRNLSKICRLPMITKTADIRQYSQDVIDVFAAGASAHDLYVLFYGSKCPINCGEDWRRGPVIV